MVRDKTERLEKGTCGLLDWSAGRSQAVVRKEVLDGWKLRTGATCFVRDVDVKSSSLRHLHGNSLWVWKVLVRRTLEHLRRGFGNRMNVVRKSCVHEVLIHTFPWRKVWGESAFHWRVEKETGSMVSAERKPHRYPFSSLLRVFWGGSCCMAKC